MRTSTVLLLLSCPVFFAACAGAAKLPVPPSVPREFRAVWVATVANSDWPSRPGLPSAEQKAEFLHILNTAQRLHLNCVVLQVRPAADAFYDSALEPWSYFLTGKDGRAPVPAYDPLAWAVHEAHLRGMQLEAWFNPFRAWFPTEKSPPAACQVCRAHPNWIVHYGSQTWLDPGRLAVQRYVLKVIADVVRRYHIDGVQIDDYFYPYPVRVHGSYLPFNDQASYRSYLHAGGKLGLHNWRRQNINRFVAALYSTVKAIQPEVLVGISPFGIWRPGQPAGIQGYDAYARIYCDSRKWLQRGDMDYLAPQLYWPIEHPAQSFTALLNWWVQQDAHARHIWPGLYIGRVGAEGGAHPWPASEIVRQIEYARTLPLSRGSIFFSASTLLQNAGGLDDQLKKIFLTPALPPASPWLEKKAPKMPVLVDMKAEAGSVLLNWKAGAGSVPLRFWVLQTLQNGSWQLSILPLNQTSAVLPAAVEEAAVSAVTTASVCSKPLCVQCVPLSSAGKQR